MTSSFKFRKTERLISQKEIDFLFTNGHSLFIHPFRIVWTIRETTPSHLPAAVAISVPKKRFKRAVDRNRIKRLIREAYRLNKGLFYDSLPEGLGVVNLMFIYSASEILPYSQISHKITIVLKRLSLEINSTRP